MHRGIIVYTLVLVTASAIPVNAQVMTRVERRNPIAASEKAFVRIAPGPLVDGALAYADRPHVYRQIPEPLVGAQYVLMSNKDRDNPNHELHVTIGQPGTLYLLIDNRVGTNKSSQTLPPNLEAAAMTWVTDMGFADTSMDVAIDENADGSIDNYYSVFARPVTPGPNDIILKAQNDPVPSPGYRSMYGVAAMGLPVKATYPVPANGKQAVALPLSSLQWTAGTTAVLHHVYLGTDPSLGPADLIAAGLTTPVCPLTQDLVADVTYYWRVDEIEADGTTVNPGNVWSFHTARAAQRGDSSPLAWWKMDEGAGTTVTDSSEHGHDAAFAAPAPTWAPGLFGGAVQFAGTGDSVVCQDGSFLNGLDAVTITAWIKSDVTYTDKGFLIFETPAGNDNMGIRYDADGALGGGWNVIKAGVTISENNASTILQLESSGCVQTTDWQHVALVWSSGQALALYLNGKPNTPTAPSAPATGTLANYSTVIIGKGGKDVAGSSWQGLIDDVRLYSKALTPEEVMGTMRGDPRMAWDPSPANGASMYVAEAVPMTWKPGDQAREHDVYLAVNQAAVVAATTAEERGTYRGRRSEPSFTPAPPLVPGLEYFWRIDEVNDDGSISRGLVWRFVLAD